MATIKNILVPVDFSEGSRAALDMAVEMARSFGASIDLLHAWQLPMYVGADAMAGGLGMSATLADEIQEQATKDLRVWKNGLRARGFPEARGLLVMSDPASAVVDTAKDYDLVVIGTHGRTGLARWALGSVAERVVRHCQKPVITVRSQPAAQKAATPIPAEPAPAPTT